MYKGLAAFFESYSITANEARNEALRPLDVSISLEGVFSRTVKVLTEWGYTDFLENKNFKEIFAKKDGFEVTVAFIKLPNSGTRIGAAIFSPNGKRTKRALIAFMKGLSEEFKDFLL